MEFHLESESSEKMYSALQEAHKNKFALYAWHLEGELLVKAELHIESYKIDRNELLLQTAPGMEFHLMQMITGEGNLHFYIPNSSLLFTSEIKKLEAGGKLTLTFPKDYSFHDRREGERLEILGLPFSVKFKIQNQEFKKSCFDISRGGLSLLFAQSERIPFKDGELITSAVLEFGKQLIPFTATVVKRLKLKPYMLESIPYGGARVSLKFEKIESKDSQLLEKVLKNIEETLKSK